MKKTFQTPKLNVAKKENSYIAIDFQDLPLLLLIFFLLPNTYTVGVEVNHTYFGAILKTK